MFENRIFLLSTVAVLFSFVLVLNIQQAEGYVTKTYTTSASGDVFSLGPVTIKLDYTMDYQVERPTEIISGYTDTLEISPTNGYLYISLVYNNKQYGPLTKEITFGMQKDVDIPYLPLKLYFKPIGQLVPTVSGPAQISSQMISLETMSGKKIPITVNNDIGNYNSVQAQINTGVAIEIGGKVDVLGFGPDLGSKIFPVETKPLISETIPIKKYYDTNLSLDVIDGSTYEYVKVKPTLTLSSGQTIPIGEVSIQLNMDGVPKTNIALNEWSNDIFTGSGSHNFQASFSETYDVYNNAKIYKSSSSNLNSFLVKSPPPVPKQTEQVEKSFVAIAEKSMLECGRGTHEENGYCVADNNGGDFFSSVFQQIEGFFKSIFGN